MVSTLVYIINTAQLQQTIAINSSYEPRASVTEEMGRHLTLHGDGVKDIAFAVEDLDSIMERAKKRGVKVIKDIWTEEDKVGNERTTII